MTTSRPSCLAGLVFLFCAAPRLLASVLSFHDVITSGATGVTFDYSGNTVTATGSIIYGNGYSATNPPPSNHGNVGANGGYTDGALFEDAGDVGLFANTTLLSGDNANVSNGDAGNMDQFLGFHIHFDMPVPMYDFYMTDLDGTEYAFSFGFNGTTALAPAITLGDSASVSIATDHALDTVVMDTAIATLTTGVDPGATVPAVVDVAFDDGGPFNVNGYDAEGQIKFAYGGALATDLFFAWGLYPAVSSGTQRSGISGISVVESTLAVPEASEALVLLLGMTGLVASRQRKHSTAGPRPRHHVNT